MDELDSFLFYEDYTIRYRGSGRPVPSTLNPADGAGTGTDSKSLGCACESRALPLVVHEVAQTVTAWEVDRVNHEPVWPAAHLLCWFLVSDAGVAACRDRRVLEVGSGVGLTGLVASHFASYVCMTDGDEEHLPLLRRNAREHAPRCQAVSEPLSPTTNSQAGEEHLHGGCGAHPHPHQRQQLRHLCRCGTSPSSTQSENGSFCGTHSENGSSRDPQSENVGAEGTPSPASAQCGTCTTHRSRVDVQHLWWGTEHAEKADADPNCPLKRHTFDAIIGSDIVYLKEGVEVLVQTIDFFLRDDDERAAAYIMNVAHHLTNLDMLVSFCHKHSLEVNLVPLDSFVPASHWRSKDAYLAKITRKRKV